MRRNRPRPRFATVILLTALPFLRMSFSSSSAEPPMDRYFGYRKISASATGFFRVEKIGKRFYFVTPEGHAFISIGINHVTPAGDYAPALGYSPYERNALEIHGTTERWRDTTLNRMSTWGFNTIGAWSWDGLFHQDMPYTVILGLASQNWQKGTISDFFDEDWKTAVYKSADGTCSQFKDDPWLLGYFIDNEMKWGPDWRGPQSVFSMYFARAADAPGKKNLIGFLRNKYKDISAFNRSYNTHFKSFDELAGAKTLSSIVSADERAFLALAANEFYRTTTAAIRKADPHHLILGDRYHALGAPEEVVKAAGKYVDVVTINPYPIGPFERQVIRWMKALTTDDFMEPYFQVSGKPILVTEIGYKAKDSGLPNTRCAGNIVFDTQKDRADAFEKFVRGAMRKPYIIGYHWFQYSDEPKPGRFDGEDCNLGLVNERDKPYAPLIDRIREINTKLYEITAQ